MRIGDSGCFAGSQVRSTADLPTALKRGAGGLVSQVVSNSYNPVDCSPPGSSVHGILQARILEEVAMSFFRESS